MHCIFVHGLGQGPESWKELDNCLAGGMQTKFPALSDLKGTGAFTYDNLYAGFKAYCSRQDGHLHLCGLSLGAVLALHYAAEHPGKIASLCLIAPQYKMPKRLLQIQDMVFHLMPKAAFAGTGLNKKEMLCLTGTMRKLDFSDRLGNISCPTLIVCGAKDLANRRTSISLSGKIPGAFFREVPGAGHEVNREAPDVLAQMLLHFWREKELVQFPSPGA